MTKTPKRKPDKSRHPHARRKKNRFVDLDRIEVNDDIATDIHDHVGKIDLDTLPEGILDPIHITEHDMLLKQQDRLFRRFNENTALSRLLLVNPVLAFKEAGITMTPEIARHVMRSVYQPTRVRNRLAELVIKLKETLGGLPKPDDAGWNARLLFEILQLDALDTGGLQPIYHAPRSAVAIKKLNERRPRAKSRYDVPGRHFRGGGMALSGPYQAPPDLRQLGLDAALPQMPTRDDKPESIPFEELYFYKDQHPDVRDVLEYGILIKRGIPIHSADSFRKIAAGEKENFFHSWISAVRFSDKENNDEPNG